MSGLVKCPGCGSAQQEKVSSCWDVYICCRCGAVHGWCPEEASYVLVSNEMADGDIDADSKDIRYYDFTVYTILGRPKWRRRHGWFDARTGKIVQIG